MFFPKRMLEQFACSLISPPIFLSDRFFMALVRYLGDEVAAKAYLFDVFYHKNNRNFVMLTIFFDTWPEILLWTGTTTSVLNPLLETIVWAIYNTGPPNSLAELKVNPSAFSENICYTSCYKNTDNTYTSEKLLFFPRLISFYQPLAARSSNGLS